MTLKISNFSHIKELVTYCNDDFYKGTPISVVDCHGSYADPRSLLGMMSLDYSHPVEIMCNDDMLYAGLVGNFSELIVK